jgi:hypothetical protein
MDDDYGDRPEYSVSYAQLDQLGPAQRAGLEGIAAAIRGGEGMSAALRKAGQLRIDPIDRFKMLCSIYYDKLGGDASFHIHWDKIIGKIETLRWTAYRNPIGFIMGARVIGRSKSVEKIRLDFACSEFKETMATESITKEDVLRYGRLWEQLLRSD